MSMTKTGLPLDLSAPVAEDTPSWTADFAGNARKINAYAHEKNEQINKIGTSQADKYSTATTYAVGDYCIYENELYKCKTAITTPENWDTEKWEKTSIAKEMISLTSHISELYEKNDDLSNSISLLNSNMNKIIRKSISGITSTSTKNLVELGVITTAGSYVVFIANTGITTANASSAYFIRYSGDVINGVTPIVEGTNGFAPRVDSSGVVTRNTSDQQYNMGFLAIKID